MVAGSLDLLQILGDLFRLVGMGDGQISKAHNRIHRCADIMGHIG